MLFFYFPPLYDVSMEQAERYARDIRTSLAVGSGFVLTLIVLFLVHQRTNFTEKLEAWIIENVLNLS